ncbi:MAG: DNA-binding protein [Planctomycetota bacterium]|nr:MAG: DNA-binding protein [Planctomycetota bacterium]
MSATQAALYLQISRQRMNQLILRGKLPAWRPHPGAPWLVCADAVRARAEGAQP